MIKFYIKKAVLFISNRFFKLLIKQVLKDKPLIPQNIPNELFEIIENINNKKYFENKIILPYIDIDILNRINIYKPYEMLEVDIVKHNSEKSLSFINTKEVVLPLALLDKNGTSIVSTENIIVEYGTCNYSLELKYKNRFHYLPIRSKKDFNTIKIKSDKSEIAIGKPILKNKPLLEKKPKLIVHIFVDALTQSMIEKFGYEIMPNTKKYFEKNGTFFTNAYAQAEWTLSSVAGIFTGKYTNEHLFYHPRRENKISHITLADTLKKSGYLTFSCTNVPKINPVNGFDKGFDRLVLAIDKDYNYIINEAIEQLDTFGGNQYLFLGFFDTHESHRIQPISSQVTNDIKDFQFKQLQGNSKDTSILYDEERINMYKNTITHFDKKLRLLYSEIDSYDKNATVVLHSDHGVNFMTQTDELLGKEREKVIFLYKNNKEYKVDNNIKEIRELPSMICDDLNIKHDFNYKYNGYSITESLYPNKEYEVAVRDETNVLFFKIPWIYIYNKNIDSYTFTTSYHLLDNEVKILEEDENYKRLVKIAQKHYIKMNETIKKKGL